MENEVIGALETLCKCHKKLWREEERMSKMPPARNEFILGAQYSGYFKAESELSIAIGNTKEIQERFNDDVRFKEIAERVMERNGM